MKKIAALISTATLLTFVGCSESHFKEDKVYAGGVYAKAEVLNKGKSIYTEYCMACHGVNGDGKGVAAKGMTVPPRDFTKGIYKFGSVASGELVHDEDLFRTLDNGLHGTAMQPWDLAEDQKFAVVQYLKSFAPAVWEGKDKKLGVQIIAGKDPYGEARKESAIERGREVYHAVAQCWNCHRAYVSKADLSSLNEKVNGKPLTEFDPTMYDTKSQPSDHGQPTIPPDFTYDRVRSAETVEELYVRIAAGVGGTTMPSWKGTIQDDEIWAVAYYVRSLMDMRATPARKALMDSIKN